MPPSAPPGSRRPRSALDRGAVVGFTLAAIAGVALSAGIARGGPILAARWGILARLALWSAVWVMAVVCCFRLPRRMALPAVFAVAVALRVAALSGPPTLSDDLYRYSWDGRVQAAGANPYRHSPDSPAVARLREPWLWPEAGGCAALKRPPGCTRINRPDVRTIYPPAAQAWFNAVYRAAGIDARHKAWQVTGLLTDLALVALLPLVLRAGGRDQRWTALYALSPLPVVEVVNNGHVDGLAALVIVAALLFALRRRPVWSGALLGVAILVKLYPAVLLVGLAGRGGRRSALRASLLPGAAAAAVVVAAGYLPHVLAVGLKVLGYLPGYLREEGYEEGGRYLLAGVVGLPPRVTAVVAAAGMVALALWVFTHRPPVGQAWVALLSGLLLATTPVQPWYAVTLLAVTAAAGLMPWSSAAAAVVVSLAAYPYFFAVILEHPHTVAIGRASYGLALAAILVAAWRGRRRPRLPISVTA